MKVVAELNKPYTDSERVDFIVEYNHNLGCEIEETETGLVAKGYTDEEKQEQEKERIAMLSLTAADVERAIYKAKGMDFEDIIKLVEQANNVDEQNVTNSSTIQPFNLSTSMDVKALKIELKANNFYRGNPYVSAVGSLLGFTSEQLDKFFETKDYTHLLPTEQVEEVKEENPLVKETDEI